MNELVSCIVTTYKRPANVVRRALESVAAQTYEPKELIVVNDYPDDTGLEREISQLVYSYSGRLDVKYILHEKNRGGCIARNTGIDNARGTIVGFLDDDDEWLPQKLERMIPYFDEGVGLVYSSNITRYPYSNTQTANEDFIRCPDAYDSDWFVHLLGSNFVGSASFPLLKKSYLIEAGEFDPNMPSMQDWDVWLRVARISKLAFCDEPLTVYYAQEDSISANLDNKKRGYDKILEKYREDYSISRKEYSLFLDTEATDFLGFNQICAGLGYLLRAIFKYPFSSHHFEVILHALSRIKRKMIQV